MKISKIIVIDTDGKEIEFNIDQGIGIFLTTDKQKLVLPTDNETLNMEMLRQIFKC